MSLALDLSNLKLSCFRASFKFTHFVDILTEEETEDVMREKNMKAAAFSALANREVRCLLQSPALHTLRVSLLAPITRSSHAKSVAACSNHPLFTR